MKLKTEEIKSPEFSKAKQTFARAKGEHLANQELRVRQGEADLQGEGLFQGEAYLH